MKWARLCIILATAILGLGGAYLAFAADDPPRWLIAISGLLFAAGVCSAIVLAAFVWVVIIEDIRPALRFRKPVVPMSLSHRASSLVGEACFREHPVRFWGGLMLNNRFFFGFMLFDQPEYLRLFTDAAKGDA